GHALGQPRAQRLENCLLGCITLGQIARRLRVGQEPLQLGGRQDAPGKAFTLALQHRLDTAEQHQIGTYSHYHWQASPVAIRVRISVTAAASPENSARAMIA